MAGGGKEEEVSPDQKLEEPLSEAELAQVKLEAIAWAAITDGQYANS